MSLAQPAEHNQSPTPVSLLPNPWRLRRDQSLLVIVDAQESLINVMAGRETLIENLTRLCHTARLLHVPLLATTQNRVRLGAIVAPVQEAFASNTPVFDKMTFSCAGSTDFTRALQETGRSQIVLCGVETHICVSQTALDLKALGYTVHVAPDAVSARTLERHKLGMERLRDFGIYPCASEAALFEWLETADAPHFRDILKIVK